MGTPENKLLADRVREQEDIIRVWHGHGKDLAEKLVFDPSLRIPPEAQPLYTETTNTHGKVVAAVRDYMWVKALYEAGLSSLVILDAWNRLDKISGDRREGIDIERIKIDES